MDAPYGGLFLGDKMIIYQMYGENGRHMAIDHTEAKRNEALGYITVTKEQYWDIERYPTVASLSEPVEIQPTEKQLEVSNKKNVPELDYFKEKYEIKFGKKPHHKLSLEKIKKALED